MGWRSRLRRGVTKEAEQTLTKINQTNLEVLDRVSARQALDERERKYKEAWDEAFAASEDAQQWLDDHPKTHSARRGDVRRLIAAIDNLRKHG